MSQDSFELTYAGAVNSGIIPTFNLPPLKSSKRFPKFVYQRSLQSEFIKLMKFWVSLELKTRYEGRLPTLPDIIIRESGVTNITTADIYGYSSTLSSIVDNIMANWPIEWYSLDFPTIIVQSSAKSAREEFERTILNIAACGNTSFGAIFVLQGDVVHIDLSDVTVSSLIEYRNRQLEPKRLLDVEVYNIGSHCSTQGRLSETLTAWSRSRRGKSPVQVFISNRNGCTINHSLSEIQQLVESSGLMFFTHSPYTINLSSVTPAIMDKGITYLVDNLQCTVAMAGKGVVVHVGKSGSNGVEVALANMETSIRSVLQYASQECPLLLETPAGQGTELCWKIEDMIEFCDRFDDDRFGVCIDTAHVHGAGYNPLEYLKSWTSKAQIKLVHFNDSGVCMGSRVDRHAPAGIGHIGYKIMESVAYWCASNNIPMVVE